MRPAVSSALSEGLSRAFSRFFPIHLAILQRPDLGELYKAGWLQNEDHVGQNRGYAVRNRSPRAGGPLLHTGGRPRQQRNRTRKALGVTVTSERPRDPQEIERSNLGRWAAIFAALDSWGKTTRCIVLLVVAAVTSPTVIGLLVWWLLRRLNAHHPRPNWPRQPGRGCSLTPSGSFTSKESSAGRTFGGISIFSGRRPEIRTCSSGWHVSW